MGGAMTSYYLSAQLSRYVDEMGGRDYLAALVMDVMEMTKNPTPPVVEPVSVAPPAAHPDLRYCGSCGQLLQHPGADICFECGARQR
jgi:hypothetical protein